MVPKHFAESAEKIQFACCTMSEKCKVRIACKGDAQSIYNVHTSSIRELCNSHYNQEEIKQWAGRQRLTKYQSLIDKEAIAVGVVDDQVVGFGNIEHYRDDTGEICGLYVSPRCSRTGVGRALLCYLEDKAKAKGYTSMRVKSTLNAEPFYQAMGYRAVREDSHVMGDGLSLRCVLMCKTMI